MVVGVHFLSGLTPRWEFLIFRVSPGLAPVGSGLNDMRYRRPVSGYANYGELIFVQTRLGVRCLPLPSPSGRLELVAWVREDESGFLRVLERVDLV